MKTAKNTVAAKIWNLEFAKLSLEDQATVLASPTGRVAAKLAGRVEAIRIKAETATAK